VDNHWRNIGDFCGVRVCNYIGMCMHWTASSLLTTAIKSLLFFALHTAAFAPAMATSSNASAPVKAFLDIGTLVIISVVFRYTVSNHGKRNGFAV
jgi:hypothetical protein